MRIGVRVEAKGLIEGSVTTTAPPAPSPTLLGWLADHSLTVSDVEAFGCSLEDDTIMYHRDHVDGSLGIKYHDVKTGKRWAKPAGWKAAETKPMMISQGGPLEKLVLFVMEGESDAMCLAKRTSATCLVCPGASIFPNEWAQYLHEYDHVYVIPDNDWAGRGMKRRLATIYPKAKFITLPDKYKDFSEWAKDDGDPGQFAIMLNSATHYTPEERLKITGTYKGDIDHSDKILRVASKHTELKRHGGEWRGLCPLHDEDTPSFFVNDKKGLWFCHGCSKGGDSIKLLMEVEGLSFQQAKEAVDRI